jgi:hypothetical protein
MQLRKSIGLYSAIIALSIGVLGVYGFQSFNLGESQTSSTNLEGSHVAGHVTMFATAADGRITAYRQSDNLITDQGADCVNKSLFAPSSGITTTCAGSPGTFNVIALGTGTAGTSRADTALGTETAVTGLARAVGSTVNATSDSATTSSGSSKVSVQNTFTNTSGGAVTITEAGLFNSTNKNIDGMFAEEPISPSIALNNNDALTVKWTISLTN